MTAKGFHDATKKIPSAPSSATVGVRTGGGVVVVDFDTYKCVTVEDKARHANLLERLPPTLTQKTVSGGLHVFLRGQLRNSASKIARHIDVRGDGGYVVSGPGYDVDEREIADAPQWLLDMLVVEAKVVKPYEPSALASPSYGRRALLEECAKIASAGEGMRNATLLDCSLRLGGLLAGGHLDEREVWQDVMSAAMSTGLSEKEAEGVVTRALAYTANDPRGPVRHVDTLGEIYVSTPGEVEMVRVVDDEDAPVPSGIPLHDVVREMGGAVSDYVSWVLETSEYAQPGLAVASLLALGGALGARRLSLSGITSSCFVVGLAGTAEGKSRPQNCFAEVLQNAWPEMVIGNDFSSTVALIDTMASDAAANRCTVVLADEYGARLRALLDARSGHQRDTRALLLAVATIGTGSYRESRSLARGGGVRVIHAPALTIYGSSTPSALHDALGQMALEDGLIGRHLWLSSDDELPVRQWHTSRAGVPGRVLEQVARVRAAHEAWVQSMPPAGVDAATGQPLMIYEPQAVTLSPGAEALLRRWSDGADDERRKNRGSARSPLLGRGVEHIMRTALALSVLGGDPSASRIEEHFVEAAIHVVESSIYTISTSIVRHRAETDYERDVQRVRRAMAAAKRDADGWITQSDITRHCQGVSTPRRREILASLIEGGEIKGGQVGDGKKATIVYRQIQ